MFFFMYNAPMQKRVECSIKGRVQGVMFRDFAQRNARKRRLVGWVKNELDGSVSLVAEGEEDVLKGYLELLKKGPLISRFVARVDVIDVVWGDARGDIDDFRIVYE